MKEKQASISTAGSTSTAAATVRIVPRVATKSRRQGWIRRVASVDPLGLNSYAFKGELLRGGVATDVTVGSILLSVEPDGSRSRSHQAYIYRVGADGELEQLMSADWKDNFLSVRDRIVELLAEPEPEPEPDLLAAATDEALLAECRRRGLNSGDGTSRP